MFALAVTLAIVPNAEVIANPDGVAFASALIVTATDPNVEFKLATDATALPLTPGAPKADVAANPVRVTGMEPSPHSS